jgi:hypothetical protein
VDDSLIAGHPQAIDHLKQEMRKYFKCKFITQPKDFLGLDLTITKPGLISLAMHTFTSKMLNTFSIRDDHPGDVLTPGRTDKKIVRGVDPEPNEQFRSKVGSLNWLTMGIRYDVVYTTKELSRVLSEPTKIANEILERALIYIKRTHNAYLAYSHEIMIAFKPPPTRKKPTDITDDYDVSYNTTDDVIHEDEKTKPQEYIHSGPTMSVMVKTDCDLAGQTETRQTTTSLMVWVSGALVHWRAHTERIIIPSTAAGEYVALSKGNTTAKFIRNVLQFYGNKDTNYFLLTDNQAAEHIATQPTMNEHSRSIDTRHHAIRQDYVNGEMRIGGVASQDNESDIMTKYLQPPLHIKHTRELNITKEEHVTRQTLSNNVAHCFTHQTTTMNRARNPETYKPPSLRTIIPRPPPTHAQSAPHSRKMDF